MIDLKLKKIERTINVLGIIIILFSIFYFIQKDIVVSGILELKSDFSKKSPMFSVLFPEQRLTKKDNGFAINESPVYFDLRSPIKFEKANIEIEFQNEEKTDIYIGIKTNEGDWTFNNYQLEIKDNPTNEFIKKNITIDIKNAKIENGNLKFMISTPEISKIQKKPIIKSINATLYLEKNRTLKQAYFELIDNVINNTKTILLKLKNKLIQ